VHEKDSIDDRELKNLLEDICIEVEVEEIAKIEGIGGLDHLRTEKAVETLLEGLVWRKKTESMSFCRIGGNDTDSSRAGNDNQVFALYGWEGEDLHRVDKRPKILCPNDVCLFQGGLNDPVVIGEGGGMELCNVSASLSCI
jgi:hypothetical protein